MAMMTGKRYWLTFCQSYGYLVAIRKITTGAGEIVQYQFNDEDTGMPHFCLQENVEALVGDEPSDKDMAVLSRIEENRQEYEASSIEFEQMDMFAMLGDDE